MTALLINPQNTQYLSHLPLKIQMPLDDIRNIHILHPGLIDGSQTGHMDAVL